jgi:hypothetical protein
VFDHGPRAGEPSQVPGLGEDCGGPDRWQPVDAGHQHRQAELVERCGNPGLDVGQLGSGVMASGT